MLLSTLAATAILIGSSQPAQTVIPPRQSATSATTSEGVEILRRILSDAIDRAFVDDEARARENVRFGRVGQEVPGLVTTLWAAGSTVSHSRAFHVPGRGLFFSLDVRLPTVSREPVADDRGPEDTHDDEWAQVRSQVRGRGGDRIFGVRQAERLVLEIDPAAVQKLTEALVTALGRHASRVEGLDSQDTITVALHLSGGNDAAWSHLNVLMDDERDEDVATTRSYVLALGAEVPERHLVVELSLADVRSNGQGGYGRLADRVRINQY